MTSLHCYSFLGIIASLQSAILIVSTLEKTACPGCILLTMRLHPTPFAAGTLNGASFLRKLSGISCLIVLLSATVWAQIPTSGNVFFGYSYARGETFSAFGNHTLNMNGWEATAQGKVLPWLGVVADFDWHYGGNNVSACIGLPCVNKRFRVNASRHTLLFGPRASVSMGRYTPFAEFLFGFAHQTDTGGGLSNSDTSFSTAIGGGLDYKLVKGVAWRVQGDSVHNALFSGSRNDLRISTGIVFHF